MNYQIVVGVLLGSWLAVLLFVISWFAKYTLEEDIPWWTWSIPTYVYFLLFPLTLTVTVAAILYEAIFKNITNYLR